MVLVIHILTALASIIYTTYTIIRPSSQRISAAGGLIVATLASGTLLVVSSRAPMLDSCLTGLAYTSAVTLGLLLARYRLASADN